MGRVLAIAGGLVAVVAAALLLFWTLSLEPSRGTPAAPSPPVASKAATEQSILQARLDALGQGFDGNVGIAVRQVGEGWVVSVNGDKPMPQQSVSKLWVTMAVLAATDRGELSLDEPVTIYKSDLSIFHQPIRDLVGDAGYTTTLRKLMLSALQRSDNAANDALARRLGGPFAVEVAVVSRNLDGVRFGPGERDMQTAAAGLTWKPEYSFGRAFWDDREALPQAKRKAALEAYLADPPDGASAVGVVNALARLHQGRLLSPESTALMINTMGGSITGAGRLRGGLPAGWLLAHKTGTGQVMGSLATGYNDVGLLTAPDGRVYAVAVLIGSTRRPLKDRQALMSSVTRAVAGVPEPEVTAVSAGDEGPE